ncbi:MAG: hypothetical protein WCG01_04620 [bacterium]
MIVTNRVYSSGNFQHHTVALANIEHFISGSRQQIGTAGLDEYTLMARANEAAVNGLLSSAEADRILGSTAKSFFRGFIIGSKQHAIWQAALARGSRKSPGLIR